MSKNNDGFILVLTLMIISILVVLVTQFFQEGQLQLFFDTTVVQREQAKQLALSGLSLAISELDVQAQAQKKKKKDEKPAPDTEKKKCSDLITTILPVLNRWQDIKLSEDKDGVEGVISLCITCEDGKLDLTQLYDAHQKKFFGENASSGPDAKKGLKALFGMLRPLVGNRDLFEPLNTWLKQRPYRLIDVTELLTNKEFQISFGTQVFKQPPFLMQTQAAVPSIILTDLFTMYGTRQPNAWFLSDSLCSALGLKRPTSQSMEELQQALNGIDCGTDIPQVLQQLYGKDIKALPQDFAPFIGINQNSAMFGVTSYGIIGTLVQGVYAIIQRTNERCRVIKLYWI